MDDDIGGEFWIRGLGGVELTVGEGEKRIGVLTEIVGLRERAGEQ